MAALCLLIAGCVTPVTHQIIPRPETATPPRGKSRVIIQRTNTMLGKYNTVDILANGSHVGSLGNPGTLIWDMEPGLLDIVGIIGGLDHGEVFFTDELSSGKTYRYTWAYRAVHNYDLISAEESEVARIAPYRNAAISILRSYRTGVTTLPQLRRDFAVCPNWLRKTFYNMRMNGSKTPDSHTVSGEMAATYLVVINYENIAELHFESHDMTAAPDDHALLTSCRLLCQASGIPRSDRGDHAGTASDSERVFSTAQTYAQAKVILERLKRVDSIGNANDFAGFTTNRVNKLEIPEIQGDMNQYPGLTTDVHLTIESVPGKRNRVSFSGKMESVLPAFDASKAAKGNYVYEGALVNTCMFAGATHTIRGTVELLSGWIFVSDPQNPMVFSLVRGHGYVYQSGRGSVITPRRVVYELGTAN